MYMMFLMKFSTFGDKVDLFSIEDYLKDTYNNCEKLSLEFNINSKVTDKNKKAIFKDVTNLSLGQKSGCNA